MTEPDRREKLQKLTKRQLQILALRCQGKTLAEIADVIDREERTVKDHMGNIYEKLGLDGLRGTARDFELAEFCRVLRDTPAAEPSPSSEPDPEPPEPPQRALVAVMEDELALMKHDVVVTVPQTGRYVPQTVKPDRRRINPFVLLFVTALGASLVSAAVVAVVVGQMRAPQTIVERQVFVPVTLAPAGLLTMSPVTSASPAAAGPTTVPPVTASAVPSPISLQAGTVLYEETWARGLENWSSSAQWKTVGGLLVNDGTKDVFGTIGDGVAFAPYRPDRANYAVEAEIQAIRTPSDTSGARFGLVGRSDGNNGYQAGLGIVRELAWIWAGDLYSPIVERRFAPGTTFHTYRLEVKDNAVRYLIDGNLIAEVTDNRFLNAGRVGLWDGGQQINVRSFRVMSL